MSDPYRLPFEPQLSLLSLRSPPNTSQEAYRSLAPSLNDLQAQVLSVLRAYPFGLTDEELCACLPLAELGDSTIRTRRNELTKAKRVEFTGELRRGASRRRARVFAVVQ